jgi:ribosomal protein S18 acetylase RimI-like enzyme
MLKIRAFLEEDAGAVVSLWERCGLVRSTNDPFKDIARKQKVRGDLFLVGLAGTEIVASAMVGYEGHRGWINYFAVCPRHRRRGHGRAMMAEVQRLLAAEGCPKINLQVRGSNSDAVGFYTAIGFVQDEVLSFGKRLEHDDQPPGPPGQPKRSGPSG